MDLTPLLAEPETSVAVVGATDSPDKYGSIIYRFLKRHGFRVFAVNPHRTTVDGDPAYASLGELPEEPTIVDVVVPAETGMKVAKEAAELGYRRLWIQPGAESPELIDYLDREGFEFIADACIMVRTRVVGR